jgi:transcriptional regulator with XRE-family HTH domain
LTKSFLSKIERGVSVPSISTAMRLAKSFGISVGQLLGEEKYDDAISVVTKADRRKFVNGPKSASYNYEMLAARKKFKTMEPYIMRPPLEFQQSLMFEHVGQEFVFVLRGAIEVEFSGKKVLLNEGDSVSVPTRPDRRRV